MAFFFLQYTNTESNIISLITTNGTNILRQSIEHYKVPDLRNFLSICANIQFRLYCACSANALPRQSAGSRVMEKTGSKLRLVKSGQQEHSRSGPGQQGSAPQCTMPQHQGWSTICTAFCATGLHERTAKFSDTSCTFPVSNAP